MGQPRIFPSIMIDPGLLKAALAKNEWAFQKLYEQCINYVFVVVNGYIKEEEDQKDVIQEIFARVFLNLRSYDLQKGEFKYWIRKVSVNCCLEFLRKSKRTNMDSLENADAIVEDSKHSEIGLTKNEIVKLLDHMPEQYRKILVMSVIDDYSHAEISETLGITPKKSRLLLYRALKWIRENRSRKELSLFSREMAIQSK